MIEVTWIKSLSTNQLEITLLGLESKKKNLEMFMVEEFAETGHVAEGWLEIYREIAQVKAQMERMQRKVA